MPSTYSPQTWHSYPTQDTPISKAALDHMEAGILQGSTSFWDASGDDVTVFNAAAPLNAMIEHGSAAAPVTTIGPTVKISRTEKLLASQMSGGNKAANEQNAALVVNSKGADATSEPQVAGVYISAQTSSTVGVGSDACAINAIGRVTGAGTGIGIGATFNGRKDTSTGKANGVEIVSSNYGGVDDSWSPTGFSNSQGIWLTTRGTNRSGAAIVISNPFNAQWDVGIGITSQGTGGPVLTTSFRDRSSSLTSISIEGSHATAALNIAAGAGSILFGSGNSIGFFGHAAAAQPTVTGSKGANAALTSLMTALAGLGLVVDSTT